MTDDEQWYANEDFWRDLESKVYTPEQLDVAAREVTQVLDILGVRSPSRVLDMCCGIGRHSLEFAARGHVVTGVDLNADYIHRAKDRAELSGFPVEFVQADMRTFTSNSIFDVAVVLWNAFGYFENDAEDLMALRSLCASLRPGGQLLIQTHGKETTARRFVRKDWFEIDDRIILDQRWIERDWARMRTRYIIIDGSRRKEYTMSCRLYSPTDLERLFNIAGFGPPRFFGGLAEVPYDEKAFELVAVAAKGT